MGRWKGYWLTDEVKEYIDNALITCPNENSFLELVDWAKENGLFSALKNACYKHQFDAWYEYLNNQNYTDINTYQLNKLGYEYYTGSN